MPRTAIYLLAALPAWAGTTGRVGGTVVNHVTGEPVPGVAIYLEAHPKAGPILEDLYTGAHAGLKPVAQSDEQGRFSAEVAAGIYRIHAEAPGYYGHEYNRKAKASVLTAFLVPEGGAVEAVAIRLLPYARLSGVVRGADGKPLEGAEVQLQTPNDPQHPSRVMRSARSGRDGGFVFERLYPDAYVIGMRVPAGVVGPSPAEDGGPRMWGRTYFPGTTDAGAARIYRIKAGEGVTDIELRPAAVRAYFLRAVVEGLPEAPCQAISLLRLTGGGSAEKQAEASPGKDRAVRFGPLEGGEYRVEARCEFGDAVAAPVPVRTLAADTEVRLELARKREAVILAELPPDFPSSEPGMLRVHQRGMPEASHAELRAERRDKLAPGVYSFATTSAGHDLIVEAVTVDGRRYPPHSVEIPPAAAGGGKSVEVRLHLARGASAVFLPTSGRDGRDLHATLLIGEEESGYEIHTWLNPAGDVVMRAVPPGTHSLLVWYGNRAPCEASVRASCQGIPVPLRLEAGQQLQVTVD